MNGLNGKQIAFIIIASVIVLVIIFSCIFFPLRKKLIRSNYRKHYHDVIYKIAVLDDYYLMTNFKFKTDLSHTATIDEILIGDKYFYIITCLYFEGELKGNETDSSLICYPSKIGVKKYTDNPLLETKKIISKLSAITGIDPSFMIGIVLVNDNCEVDVVAEKRKDGSEIPLDEKIYFFSKRKNFEKLIKSIESRDVGTLNAEQLDRLVKSMEKNIRKR